MRSSTQETRTLICLISIKSWKSGSKERMSDTKSWKAEAYWLCKVLKP